jgi:hypothetical protein
VLVIFAHVRVESFEVLHQIFSVQFPNLLFVDLGEDFLDLGVVLLIFLLDSVLLSFAILVNEIVELDNFLVGCNNLGFGGLQQEFDAISDGSFNFEVWLNQFSI